jgi:beta-phosphoglucomutase-like phosphatase (HAD superfamily)
VIGSTLVAAGGSAVEVDGIVSKVLIPALLSPILAGLVAALGVFLVYRIMRPRAGRIGRRRHLPPHAMNDRVDVSRPRPVTTVLDLLRARIDHDAFDAAIFALEAVVADLGYGDLRALPGSVAWIDRLGDEGKATALVFSGDSAASAPELAGVRDRFDAVVSGPRSAETLRRAAAELDAAPERVVVVETTPEGIVAACELGVHLAIAVARGSASPEELRRGGAAAVVADLQELLGPT